MRHLKAGRKLGRTSAHRKALFRNLVTALIVRERIQTTLAKAKELRSKAEKTITLGKKGTLHARRLAFRTVQEKEALKKLFGPIAERFATRNGGYTRIIKIGSRKGDDAPMAFIELVEADSEIQSPKSAKVKKEAKPKAGAKKADAKKETAKKTETGKTKKSSEKKGETAPAKKESTDKE
ncbi:MAG: 50S ribosomal protein L17 [Nitrospinae bacterium]|jgi:large subunit ribosomal protein L17|nr:50S ribosomal protein L17 [Nitrospinota bacterium]MDA1109350.1 50S ribosomal protein L17 [Nitrospinota bacterium]